MCLSLYPQISIAFTPRQRKFSFQQRTLQKKKTTNDQNAGLWTWSQVVLLQHNSCPEGLGIHVEEAASWKTVRAKKNQGVYHEAVSLRNVRETPNMKSHQNGRLHKAKAGTTSRQCNLERRELVRPHS